MLYSILVQNIIQWFMPGMLMKVDIYGKCQPLSYIIIHLKLDDLLTELLCSMQFDCVGEP